jgi:hypothetical protein
MSRFNVRDKGWSPEATAWLIEHWPDLSISTETIGRTLGCSGASVRHKRMHLGLPPRPSPLDQNSVTRFVGERKTR